MTSVMTTTNGKDVHNARSKEPRSATREGIFQKFSRKIEHMIQHYYTVDCSTDINGNIKLHGVKRENFSPDVKMMSDESDVSDVPTDDVTENRYRLRTRRTRKQREDELDVTLCDEISDDEFNERNQPDPCELSSDDDTYDVTTDNWTYVRCAKKKVVTESSKISQAKTSPSKKCAKAEPKKRTSLRVKLKPKEETKTDVIHHTRNSHKAASLLTSSRTVTSPKKTRAVKPTQSITTESIMKDMVSLKNPLTTSKVPTRSSKSVTSANSSFTTIRKTIGISTSLPMMSSNIKRLRRCGYNSTSPKMLEIRHIRRRMLKQNPKQLKNRQNSDDNSPTSSGGELSEEDDVITRNRATSSDGRDVYSAISCGQSATSSTTDVPKPSPKNAGNSSTIRGLKLVIRRQSLENHPVVAAGTVRKIDSKSNAEFQAPSNEQTVNMKSPVSTGTTTFPITRESTVKSLVTASSKNDVKEEKNKPMEGDTDERKTEGNGETVMSEGGDDETNIPADNATNKSNDADTLKKKKQKRKKRKDRGRVNSSAASEEPFDAEHTEMRLGMELPRHNWLVKHLIKENKLKAEDAKPANSTPEQEDTKLEETSQHQVKDQSSANTVAAEPKEGLTVQAKLSKGEPKVKVDDVAKVTCESTDLKAEKGEILKTVNTIKGSYMVGIVKPFQHLKMFPVTMSNDGFDKGSCSDQAMSPPDLCIVDEEDAAPGEKKGNEKKQESSCDDNSNTKSENTLDPVNLTSNPLESTPTKSASAVTSGPEAEKGSLIEDSRSEIKISSCFSLALDLTKKNETFVLDKPLDLSIGAKEPIGDVLDLSVKKPKPAEMVQKATISQTRVPSTPPATQNEVIVIEDNDDHLDKTEKGVVKNLTGISGGHLNKYFVKLTNTGGDKCVQTSVQNQPQEIGKLKRHISAPAYPDVRPPANATKRHQSLDTENNQLTTALRKSAANVRPVKSVQLDSSPEPDLKRRRMEFNKHMANMNKVSLPVRSEVPNSGHFAVHQQNPTNQQSPQSVQFSKSSTYAATNNNLLQQISTHAVNYQSKPGEGNMTFSNRRQPVLGSPQTRQLPITTSGHQMMAANQLPVSRQMMPQEALHLNHSFAGGALPTLPRMQRPASVAQAVPRMRFPTPTNMPVSFPTYTRVPQDVNNNNITSLAQPRARPRQLYNPPRFNQTGFPPNSDRLPGNHMKQVVRAPPGGVPINRVPQQMHYQRQLQPQGGYMMAGNRPLVQNMPNRPPMLEQQRRVVDEKIQQLEAIKRNLIQRESLVKPDFQTTSINNQPPPAYLLPTNRAPTVPHPRPVPPIRTSTPQPIQSLLMMSNAQVPPQMPNPSPQGNPVYRNGGLSINRRDAGSIQNKLNEPIVIDDDFITGSSRMAKNRHTYSFHPPLSKNKDNIPNYQPIVMSQPNKPNVTMPASVAERMVQPNLQYRFAHINQGLPNAQQAQKSVADTTSVEVCVVCRRKSFFLCSGCKKTWYCSKDCQFKDWAAHCKHCTG